MTPHVLFLPSFYTVTGKPFLGSFFKNQALTLKHFGINIDVVFLEVQNLRNFSLRNLKENYFQITTGEEDGIFTMRQKGWNPLVQTLPGGLLWASLTSRLVDRYIKRFGLPHLIHAHNVFWAGYACLAISRKYNIPYVITEHSSAFLIDKINRRAVSYAVRAFSGAAKVIAVSQSLSLSLNDYLCQDKAIVVPNVVDTDFFCLPPSEPGREPYIFLSISNLNANKGIHILLRAFAEVFRNKPDVFLHVGGDGPQRFELEALSNELGIGPKVRFFGYMSREDVRTAMWNSNILVLPSFHETFGVVLIEALSTGLPVVATRSGGPEDIVNSEVGLLVEVGNVKDLAEALNIMWNHPGFSRKAVRNYAINHFSEKTVAGKLKDIYLSVLGGRE